MSILIKGMEMPPNCDKCRIMTYEDTNCISVHELYCGCPIVFRAHPQHEEHRPDYCPLVEVPPHGRLIVADAAVANRNVNMNWCYDLSDLPDYLADCPTIIEAEGEE